MLGDAADTRLSDPGRIIAKLHVKWGRSPAHQLKRVLEDSGRKTMGSANYVGGALERRKICRAVRKAPRLM